MTAHTDVARSSASPEWPTPPGLFAALAAEFGPFDLDHAAPLPQSRSTVTENRA